MLFGDLMNLNADFNIQNLFHIAFGKYTFFFQSYRNNVKMSCSNVLTVDLEHVFAHCGKRWLTSLRYL